MAKLTSIDDFFQKQRGDGYMPEFNYQTKRPITALEKRVDNSRINIEIDLFYFSQRIEQPGLTLPNAVEEWEKRYGRQYRNFIKWDRFYRNG